jgi:glyoxylase-like metal-dependent hydrolase (beta-lactamase superfamily II)
VNNDAALQPASDLGDGIAQIRLPMTGNPLRYINGYLIDDDGGFTLVDCGWKADDVLAALHEGLHALGHKLSDVRRVVITHHHFDHYGLAATLLRAGVPELLMHELDWERARVFAASHAENDRAADAWLTRNGFTPEDLEEGFAGRWEVIEPTRLVADGERIGRLGAMWTPGHSPGHLCLADTHSERMLTGDHVLDPITPHIGLWREREGDPLGDYLASLTKVRGHGDRGALPAHGEPFPDLDRRVDELIAHTAARDAQIVDALAAGTADAGEIAARLPWTRRNRSFADLGQFHQQFAVSETIAHLQHLYTRGLVAREMEPAHIRYALVA